MLILFFSCFTAKVSFAQTCNEKDEWIAKAKKDQQGDYDCELIRNSLKNILKDCLLTNDSFHYSLWHLYVELGYNYYRCGPEEDGLNYFYAAIKARQNSNEVIPEDLGRIYRLLASDYYYLGDIQQAFIAINKAIEYFEKQQSDYLPDSYKILADLYTEIGDYNQALTYLHIADKTTSRKELFDLFLVKVAKAKNYEKLNQYKNSLQEYQNAKTVLEEIGLENNLTFYAQIHSEIGNIYILLGSFVSSASYLNKAHELFIANPNSEPENFIINYSYLTQLHIKLKQYNKAGIDVGKALAIADTAISSAHYPPIGELYYLRGKAYTKQQKFDKAFEDFQQAIKVLVPSFQPQSTENPVLSQQPTGDKIRLRTILKLKAEAFRQQYQSTQDFSDLEKAHDTYLTLDTLITQTRQSFKAVGSKYFLQKKIVPIYEEAVEVALQLYKETNKKNYLESAHQFMGRNKSIILIEGLQDEKVKFVTIPNQLIQEETQLKKAYYDWEISLYEAESIGDTITIQEVKDSLFTTKRAYENLIQIFEKDYPKYYQSKYDYYSKIRVSDIQSKLERNRAVVEFFIGEKSLFVSVIAKDQFEIFQSPLPEDFEELCFDFIEMTRGDSNENLEKRFSKRSYELYQYLFEPALKNLNPSINRLTIIPDDILLHLSFDVLLTEPYTLRPENWDDLDLPYFIRKYAYHQVYANSLLFDEESQQRVSKATKGFLGFGLEYFDKNKWSQEDSLSQNRISGPLPYSDDEVLAIQELMGGEVHINEEATKQSFLNAAKDYDLLHFAMHGYADEKSPLNSALVFDKIDDSNDHLLKIADLYAMKLPASMAYLSACQTNYSALQKGEGMPTISRAFAYAGCPSVVASLWNIPDKSSMKIATAFYENLQKNQTKDVALRNAKLSYLENEIDINRTLPNFWAQTIVIGNPEPLKEENNYKVPFLLMVGGICFFLIIFLFRRINTTLSL